MKTKFISLVICIFFLNVMQAQDIEQNNNFLLGTSVGLSDEFKPALALNVTYSHEYSNYFTLGAGSGVHYQAYKLKDDAKSYSLELPVFVNIRGNLIKSQASSNVIPYYSLNLGFFFSLMKSNYEYTVIQPTVDGVNNSYTDKILRYYEGLFLAPELGVSINDICIGVEFLYGTIQEEQHIDYIYPSFTFLKNNSSYKSKPSYVISLKFVQML